MKLILLGTSGYHPNDRRETACLMLPEMGVLLDAGTALYRISEYLETDELDIFITHAHLDHIIGLTYLLDALSGRLMRRVTVHSLPEMLDAIRTHLFAKPLFPVAPPFEMRPLDAVVDLPQGCRITHFPLEHPGGSLGFRLDWPDRSLAYVTDTTASPDAAYLKPIQGVDLLVHECYFTDDLNEKAQLTGHSCTTAVGQVAKTIGAGRLILIHINPLETGNDPIDIAAARRIFPNTEVGEDRMEVEV